MIKKLLKSRRFRLFTVVFVALALVGVIIWRGPEFGLVKSAFETVSWIWVVAALGANLLSTWLRAIAWQVTVAQAIPAPLPTHGNIFSAFSIGLVANVALPGRIGEFARVGVLSRHISDSSFQWPAVAGSIFAHRVLDVVPTAGLAIYVLVVARLPSWAENGVYALLAVGGIMLVFSVILAKRRRHVSLEEKGRFTRILYVARWGLSVFRRPGAVVVASTLQGAGWATQLLAVWLALRAFGIREPIAAAALVLLIVNVALAFPLWPSAIGLYQAGVALALLPYGISYSHGFAAGVGLQVIEVAVGVSLGLFFLAREGLSFTSLKEMPHFSGQIMRLQSRVYAGKQ